MTQAEQDVREELAKRSVTAADLVDWLGITRQYASIILGRMHKAGEVTRERVITGKMGQPAYLYTRVTK